MYEAKFWCEGCKGAVCFASGYKFTGDLIPPLSFHNEICVVLSSGSKCTVCLKSFVC